MFPEKSSLWKRTHAEFRMEAPKATLGACPMHFQWLSHNFPDLKTAWRPLKHVFFWTLLFRRWPRIHQSLWLTKGYGSQAIFEILLWQKFQQDTKDINRLIQGLKPHLLLNGIPNFFTIWFPKNTSRFSSSSRFILVMILPFRVPPGHSNHSTKIWPMLAPSDLDQAHLMQRSRLPSWCTWERGGCA